MSNADDLDIPVLAYFNVITNCLFCGFVMQVLLNPSAKMSRNQTDFVHDIKQ